MEKVVKFGGSSLASAEQFKKVKAIIEADRSRNFVIPSAPGKRNSSDAKVTDLLYEYYDLAPLGNESKIIREKIKNRFQEIIEGLGLDLDLTHEYDRIDEKFKYGCGRDYAASRGEYLNGIILAHYLQIPFIDAAEVICFDEDGNFMAERTNLLLEHALENVERAVIPGFYGSLPNGTIKTFSRGGSDITGSLVARAVHATLYENWTDVSGFLLADPRIVENPVPIATITYKELHELSCMGASVLHEDAVFPVKHAGIPINIRNTNRPEDPGTMIVDSTDRKPNYKITGIAGKKGFCAVNISKSMLEDEHLVDGQVLSFLEEKKIPFECMPSDQDTMSILVHQEEFKEKEKYVLSSLRSLVKPEAVSLESDLALVAVGVRGRKAKSRIAGRVFTALENANIPIHALDQEAEEFTTLIGVRNVDFEPAVRAIYDNFIHTDCTCGSAVLSI